MPPRTSLHPEAYYVKTNAADLMGTESLGAVIKLSQDLRIPGDPLHFNVCKRPTLGAASPGAPAIILLGSVSPPRFTDECAAE